MSRTRRVFGLSVLVVGTTAFSFCPTAPDNGDDNELQSEITGATLDNLKDELVLYGTFPSNSGGQDLKVQLSDSTVVTQDFPIKAYALGQVRIALPRAAMGTLRVRNTVEFAVSNKVTLTSWTGNVKVLNEYTATPPTISTLATQVNCTLHFRGILDPLLTQNTIAVALDSRCTLSALGLHTDPAGGINPNPVTYTWSLRGAPDIVFENSTETRRIGLGIDPDVVTGRVNKLHVRITALVSDGVLQSVSGGSTSISPFSLDSSPVDIDIDRYGRILFVIKVPSGQSSIVRTITWGDMEAMYPWNPFP